MPNSATPVEWIDEVLGDLDLVLLMSVNPGFGGQASIPQTLAKIGRVCARIERDTAETGRLIRLQVDGGVKADNIAAIAAAGADTFVAGSAVFGKRDADGGYRGTLDALRSAAAHL